MTKIFINPGHSLNCKPDAGCCYNGIKEAEICAELANKVSILLKDNNFDVELYQQCGDALTANQQLNEVAKIANLSKADLLVSIHMNGFTSSEAKGTETWYYKGSVKSEKAAKLINDELVKPFESYTLTNRGAKIDTRGLLVLKATIMPAVLTEIGFISNQKEAEFIKTNIDEIAKRLSRAICTYFDKTFIEPNIASSTKEFKLVHQGDNKYDCFVDGILKLKSNKLLTCTKWIEDNYNA